MRQAPYEKLLTYRYSIFIADLTEEFVQKFLPGRENLRTREQMTQAARSGKQCIVEGASQGTSLKGYLKMLGVTRGSFEELLEDYKDISRRRGIQVWDQEGLRRNRGCRIFVFEDRPDPPKPPLPRELEISVNMMIDILKRTNYLLDQQKRSLEEKFVQEGGYTENLFKRRLQKRRDGDENSTSP